jgi:hypothetical protein
LAPRKFAFIAAAGTLVNGTSPVMSAKLARVPVI